MRRRIRSSAHRLGVVGVLIAALTAPGLPGAGPAAAAQPGARTDDGTNSHVLAAGGPTHGWIDRPARPPKSPQARTEARSATTTPRMTFSIDSSSWTPSEQATLRAWTSPGSLQMNALLQVAGHPGHDELVHIARAATGYAGMYDANTDTLTMDSLELDVFMHELNHATHDSWIINNSVWEEGMARAAEVAELNLLATQGVPEAVSYSNLHHSDPYDEYYENSNVPDVGVAAGDIFGHGGPALPLLRYEQAGYAFGKLLIQNGQFIVRFNGLLFQQLSGSLSVGTLVNMAASVQPMTEGQSFSSWYRNQHIFDTAPPTGCRLFQRTSQFTVDFFCRSADGYETPQSGATITYAVSTSTGTTLYTGQAVTGSYGWASFSPNFGTYDGRVTLVASTNTPTGTISSTSYRQSGPESGVFGVVTNTTTGTVVFSSPSGAFTDVTVAVANGAFSASSLETFTGLITARVGEGAGVSRTFAKDSSPYSLVIPGSGVTRYENNSVAITYLKTWTAKASAVWSGGSEKYSIAAGASATFTFTGTQLSWVSSKASNRGSGKVYLDGVLVKTVSTYSTTTQNSVLVWKSAVLSRGSHKVKIVVAGTAGHPRVGIDAFDVAP